jgi:glycosyltransferase involved in cell wall biosynthesis
MGSVGRISAGKGWQTMLHACALLKMPYRLIIVGDGPEAAQMEALIDKLQLREFITRYPLLPQEKLPEIYSSIDVFLFPTERAGESLGLVGLEAMACGTPVISSDFAAPADYVRDGVNGFQFPKGDAAGLADAITRCMQADLDTLGKNAMQTAAGYNASQVTQTMKSILLG